MEADGGVGDAVVPPGVGRMGLNDKAVVRQRAIRPSLHDRCYEGGNNAPLLRALVATDRKRGIAIGVGRTIGPQGPTRGSQISQGRGRGERHRHASHNKPAIRLVVGSGAGGQHKLGVEDRGPLGDEAGPVTEDLVELDEVLLLVVVSVVDAIDVLADRVERGRVVVHRAIDRPEILGSFDGQRCTLLEIDSDLPRCWGSEYGCNQAETQDSRREAFAMTSEQSFSTNHATCVHFKSPPSGRWDQAIDRSQRVGTVREDGEVDQKPLVNRLAEFGFATTSRKLCELDERKMSRT